MAQHLKRRQFLAGTALVAATVPLAAPGSGRAALVGTTAGDFTYEVTRTEAEWRSMLSDQEFEILRNGATEKPGSSPFWQGTKPGTYRCRGCELPVYHSDWYVQLEKGWVFFRHGIANSQMQDIDWPDDAMFNPVFAILTSIETHCRRCGSHLGHILEVDGKHLHCINGASLTFEEKFT